MKTCPGPLYSDDLKGLARQCPKCNVIAHHDVKGRKAVTVVCPLCDFKFQVKKYKKGERPKAKAIKGE